MNVRDTSTLNPDTMEDARKSGKLREFSERLASRLQAAPSPLGEAPRLAVRIGPDAYVLDMNTAGRIVTAPPITPVPWTKPWYLGLANVRGRLVGVVDLPSLAGGAPLKTE